MKSLQAIEGSISNTIATAKTVEPQKPPVSVMPPAPSISNSAAHPPRPPSANLIPPPTETVEVKEEDFHHYNSKLTIQDFDLLKVRVAVNRRS